MAASGSRHHRGMASLIPLIETYRGGTLECVHFGAVAVTDTDGRVVAQVGDPHWLTFTRSTLKALQALPFMQGGGAGLFGFSREQLAMLCASHSGGARHVTQVQGMLDKIGLTYRTLQCGCHVPMFAELGIAPAPESGSYDERHHNCSGKHAGFLAYCVQHACRWAITSHPPTPCSRRSAALWRGPSAWRPISSKWVSMDAPRQTTRSRWPTSRAAMRAWPAVGLTPSSAKVSPPCPQR